MGRGQALELGDDVGMAAQVQVRFDPGFQRLQPHLGEPWHLPERQQVRRHIRQRLAPPQRERRPRLPGRLLPRPGPCRRPRGIVGVLDTAFARLRRFRASSRRRT